MIEQVRIRNFQSHKDTTLTFKPGINLITGNSDCGKSAIMRAFYWAIENTRGDAFVSSWATKNDECSVTLRTNDNTIKRIKDSKVNGYFLNDSKFEALKGTVPEQVTKALNLCDAGIQKQLDAPGFLLAMSSGEVSRYINSLVNLTSIDDWLTATKSNSQGLQKNINELEANIRQQQEIIDGIPDLESARGKLDGIKADEMKLADLQYRTKELGNQINIFENSDVVDCSIINGLVSKVEGLKRELSQIHPEVSRLEDSVTRFTQASKNVSDIDVTAIINRIERCQRTLHNIGTERSNLETEVSKADQIEGNLNLWQPAFEEIKKQLDTMVCPLCGRSGIHED